MNNNFGGGGGRGYDNRGGGGAPPRRDFSDNNSGGNDVAKALESKDKIILFTSGNTPGIRPELLDGEAQDAAKRLKDVQVTQLRRNYAPVVALKQRLEIDSTIADLEVQAQVAAMKAKAAYAGARKQPIELVRFFVLASNSIKTRADFLAFARHFEAVIAFHKVFVVVDKKG